MTFNSKTYSMHGTIAKRDPAFRMTLGEFRELILTTGRVAGTADLLWVCRYCRGIVGVEGLSIDHALPLTAGGRSDRANLTPCCKDCNSAKGELGAEQFSQLRTMAMTWPQRMRAYLFRKLQAMPQGWVKAREKQREQDKDLREIARAGRAT